MTRFEVAVDLGAEGKRLDSFLVAQLPDHSRSSLQRLVKGGAVSCGGETIVDPSHKVRSGEAFTVVIPRAEDPDIPPTALPLEILFEDDDVLVLEKPAGLVVHPAPGHRDDTLVNALISHCGDSLSGIGGIKRPGIVHRLDKDVSGVMVVAKNDRAHIRLAAQFSVHSVDRIYEALVWGVPTETQGTIEGAIGRHPKDRKRMAMVERGGKHAVTHFRLLRTLGGMASLLELRLETGRTHQIRVHLCSNGLAIIGDRLYKARRMGNISDDLRVYTDRLDRIALHARRLGFDHPATGQRHTFETEMPALFDEIFSKISS